MHPLTSSLRSESGSSKVPPASKVEVPSPAVADCSDQSGSNATPKPYDLWSVRSKVPLPEFDQLVAHRQLYFVRPVGASNVTLLTQRYALTRLYSIAHKLAVALIQPEFAEASIHLSGAYAR